jgi:cob(I)alamin adenosyltransferase
MDQGRIDRHNNTMKRKKEVIDNLIDQAQQERGLVIFITGNGKGKSTSAFGTAFRALGHGHQVGVAQFIKGTQSTGEVVFLQHIKPQLDYFAMATGFTWDTQDWDKDKAAAEETWGHAKRMLQSEQLNLVVLDELTYMLKFGYLDVDEVVSCIKQRPHMQTVIITGRGAKPELVEIADTVSEIRDVKHAFRAGVKAQAGIDF